MNDDGNDIYTDTDGKRFWLNVEGDPDFNDPVITFQEWLKLCGVISIHGNNIEEKIVNSILDAHKGD